jgi:thioredoxin-related protein
MFNLDISMKKITFILTGILLLVNFAFKAQQKSAPKKEELKWYDDLMKANEISEKTKKPIFAMFTGSDWCGWCKKLQADVFAKPEFVKWAEKNVVLMEVDFPRGKQLSPVLQQQNNSLQQSFGVAGYPTVWMFYLKKDEAAQKFNIIPLGSLGYPTGTQPGKEEVKFIDDANLLFKKFSETKNQKK